MVRLPKLQRAFGESRLDTRFTVMKLKSHMMVVILSYRGIFQLSVLYIYINYRDRLGPTDAFSKQISCYYVSP